MGLFDSLASFGSKAMDFGKGLVKEDEYGQNKLGLFGDRLLDIDDGGERDQRNTATRQNIMGQRKSEAQRQALYAKGQELGLTPAQLFALQADPGAFAKSYAESQNRPPQVVGGGSSVYEGGQFHTAPMLGQHDGVGFNLSPDGMTETGRLNPSFSEQTARLNNEEDARLKAQEMQQRAAQKQQNFRLQQQREARMRAAGGSGGAAPSLPPGFVMEK